VHLSRLHCYVNSVHERVEDLHHLLRSQPTLEFLPNKVKYLYRKHIRNVLLHRSHLRLSLLTIACDALVVAGVPLILHSLHIIIPMIIAYLYGQVVVPKVVPALPFRLGECKQEMLDRMGHVSSYS